MSYFGWKPYVPVAERRQQAAKAVAKANKTGTALAPITVFRGAIAKTFWGKAWCENLERYSDYDSRLPRGRAYARNGAVIDLAITAGEVRAQVMGSSLYRVEISVATVPARQWRAIGKDCSGSIDSLVELLQGKLANAVMARICQPGSGLFPAPKDIKFSCSCPDWATLCKHVAAALYGIGARLDQQPELLFKLRHVDAKDLVAQASAGLPKAKTGPAATRVLDDAALADVFGIEMAEAVPPRRPAARGTKRPVTKATKATKTVKPTGAPTKSTTRAVAKRAAAVKPATDKSKPASKAAAQKSAPAKAFPGSAELYSALGPQISPRKKSPAKIATVTKTATGKTTVSKAKGGNTK